MASDFNNEIQVRQAAFGHLDTIIDFNIAMAKETEDKDVVAEEAEGTETVDKEAVAPTPEAPQSTEATPA